MTLMFVLCVQLVKKDGIIKVKDNRKFLDVKNISFLL